MLTSSVRIITVAYSSHDRFKLNTEFALCRNPSHTIPSITPFDVRHRILPLIELHWLSPRNQASQLNWLGEKLSEDGECATRVGTRWLPSSHGDHHPSFAV